MMEGDNSTPNDKNTAELAASEDKEEGEDGDKEGGNMSPMEHDGEEESDDEEEEGGDNKELPTTDHDNPGHDLCDLDPTQADNPVGVDKNFESKMDDQDVADKNVISDVQMEKVEDASQHNKDQEDGDDERGDSKKEIDTQNMLSSDNPDDENLESNHGGDSQDKLKDHKLPVNEGGEADSNSNEQSDANVCNENNTDIPSDALQNQDGEKDDSVNDIHKGADKDNVEDSNTHKPDAETTDAKSGDEGVEYKDSTKNAGPEGNTGKTEDIEVIKVVTSDRTVTRKSIPADSKNSKEAGEIEILRVDIVNKPKRKDRKGDRRRHGSTSSLDSHSEEEGAIPERKDTKVKDKKKKKNKDSKRQSKDRDLKGKKTGDSSAEEGEVKSDDEGGGKKKKKRNKKKKNKDKRNVVVDSTDPKMLIPELSKAQKGKDGKKSDSSDMSKSKERGNYGDLRQVIQVKRDSHTDEEVVRRYEAYWNEFGKRRGDERRVESASQWEQLYSYGAFGFGEGKQWENFTVQRERSPIYDRRKEKDIIGGKRVDARRTSRDDRSMAQRQFRQEKETMAERAVRLEREAAKRERQLQESSRRGGREHLTMAEREARELMRSRMDAHIERKYGKQGFLTSIGGRHRDEHDHRVSARDKHGREQSYENSDRSKDKSRERDRLREKDLRHNDHSRERKRHRREVSRSSRSRDEYSSDRHRSRDRRSYDSDMSRSSSRSMSVPSDKEPEPPKALPKTSTVPKPSHASMPGQKPPEVTKKKKKDKTKGKKDKKTKEAKKAAKKAKGAKAGKDKAGVPPAAGEAGVAQPEQPSAAKRPPGEAQAADQPPAKKQKKIKGKKDKKKKKAAKLAAKAGKVPAPRPTCLIQDDEDPDIIDLTGEIEDRSPTPSTPPTPKPATPTKPPPKDPSPIVSSTADIRDANNPSSSLYDPFEPTASPPVSYSNSPSPISTDGGMQMRKGPSSSMPRVTRGSGDREREVRDHFMTILLSSPNWWACLHCKLIYKSVCVAERSTNATDAVQAISVVRMLVSLCMCV